MISFSCFGFVVFVLANPETETVSHFFPKVCAALQRKFGADGACRARRRYVFGLVSHERITTTDTALGSAAPVRHRLPKSEICRSLRRHASHLGDARCDAEIILGSC